MASADTKELSQPDVRCPRCGYDQRGVIAAWTMQCPLVGKCAECGLGFEWAELLAPYKFVPRWSIEFAGSVVQIPIAWLWTVTRALWPWRFWSQFSVAAPVRGERLVCHVGLVIGFVVLLYVALQTTAALLTRHRIESEFPGIQADAVRRALIGQAKLKAGDTYIIDAGQRIDISELMKQNVARAQSDASVLYVIEFSRSEAVLEALLHPLARQSSGRIRTPDGSRYGYRAPSAIYKCLCGDDEFSLIWAGCVERILSANVVAVAMMLLMPMAFALLPYSMKRARVRWHHMFRICVYSLSLIVPLFLIQALAIVLLEIRGPHEVLFALTHFPLIAVLIVPVWWFVAMKEYLCFPRPWVVLMLLSALLYVALAWLIYSALPGDVQTTILG